MKISVQQDQQIIEINLKQKYVFSRRNRRFNLHTRINSVCNNTVLGLFYEWDFLRQEKKNKKIATVKRAIFLCCKVDYHLSKFWRKKICI